MSIEAVSFHGCTVRDVLIFGAAVPGQCWEQGCPDILLGFAVDLIPEFVLALQNEIY